LAPRRAAFAEAPACQEEVISSRSPMYRTETSARLCGKCRNLKNHGLRGCHGWILACRLTETPYKLHTRFIALYESTLSTESVVCFVSVLTKRRLFEARLAAQRMRADLQSS
jgi:hypothetical protein